MKTNSVVWFEIYVQDADRAKRFYERVLAISLEKLKGVDLPMWAFPNSDDAAGAGGALVSVPGMPSGGNSTLVYFSCEDCANEESRVEASGGTLVRAKMSIGPYGFVSLAKDPDGNMIGLHSTR